MLTSAGVGVVASAAAAFLAPWQLSVLAGWTVGAGLFAVRLWARVRGMDAAHTREVALLEDDSRPLTQAILIVASLISLVGVGVGLLRASQISGGMKIALSATAVLTVGVSWTVVHLIYMLRYAHLFYGDPVGGIDFSAEEEPDYHDFAYVAFTIGMTFQVSDTDLTTAQMRRLALRHALLAFLFGAVILATTINITAGFIR